MDFADDNLKAALESLLPRDRRILEMRAAGNSFVEIGQALNVSRSTAYRLAQIARQKLNARSKAAARSDRWRNVLAGGAAPDTSRADKGVEPVGLEEGKT